MTREEWRAFVKEVHENAVRHGFWKNCDPDTVFALIHCEWSEAMEEYRRDNPMLYYVCEESGEPCREAECGNFCKDGSCAGNLKNHKPEGVAVELIDGCLRLLDVAMYYQIDVDFYIDPYITPQSLPSLVMTLHNFTQRFYSCVDEPIKAKNDIRVACVKYSIERCIAYLRAHRIDPESVMIEKHEYNKSRPYLHGKKC